MTTRGPRDLRGSVEFQIQDARGAGRSRAVTVRDFFCWFKSKDASLVYSCSRGVLYSKVV